MRWVHFHSRFKRLPGEPSECGGSVEGEEFQAVLQPPLEKARPTATSSVLRSPVFPKKGMLNLFSGVVSGQIAKFWHCIQAVAMPCPAMKLLCFQENKASQRCLPQQCFDSGALDCVVLSFFGAHFKVLPTQRVAPSKHLSFPSCSQALPPAQRYSAMLHRVAQLGAAAASEVLSSSVTMHAAGLYG